jgi:hypothetical protein
MLNDTVGRAIPIERVAVKLDGADRTRPYIGAAPAPGFRPEFATNGKIGVFQRHSRLCRVRMAGQHGCCSDADSKHDRQRSTH